MSNNSSHKLESHRYGNVIGLTPTSCFKDKGMDHLWTQKIKMITQILPDLFRNFGIYIGAKLCLCLRRVFLCDTNTAIAVRRPALEIGVVVEISESRFHIFGFEIFIMIALQINHNKSVYLGIINRVMRGRCLVLTSL